MGRDAGLKGDTILEVKRKRTRQTQTKRTWQAIRCADYQVSRLQSLVRAKAVSAVAESFRILAFSESLIEKFTTVPKNCEVKYPKTF